MKKTPHIILGVTKNASDKVELLRKNGESEVYILDMEQADTVRERDGIMYVSEEIVSTFFMRKKEIVFHLYKPGGKKRKK